MTYPFIPIGLISIFILVILYLVIIKKDIKQLKNVLYPGLFFIAIWAVIYYFLLKLADHKMFQNKTRLASMFSHDIPQLIPQDVPVPSQDVLEPISTDVLNLELEQTISKFNLKVFIYVIAAHPIQFTYSRRFSPWFLIHYLFANLIFSSSYSSVSFAF